MSWSMAAACLVPKLSSSAVHMKTDRSLAVSQYSAATGLVPDMSRWAFRLRTGQLLALSRPLAVGQPGPATHGVGHFNMYIVSAPDLVLDKTHEACEKLQQFLWFRRHRLGPLLVSTITIFLVGLFPPHRLKLLVFELLIHSDHFPSAPHRYTGKKILAHVAPNCSEVVMGRTNNKLLSL